MCNGTNWVGFGAASATILGVASSVTVTPQAPTIAYSYLPRSSPLLAPRKPLLGHPVRKQQLQLTRTAWLLP
jgi:hypothetical protein